MMLLHTLAAFVASAAVTSTAAECVGPRGRCTFEDDAVSLLQSSSHTSKQRHLSLAERRANLKAKITRSRLALAKMEMELADLDTSLAHETAVADESSKDAASQEHKPHSLVSGNSSHVEDLAVPRWESLSFLQTSSRALLSSRGGDHAAAKGGVWIGSVLYKYGVTQAFSEGQGCRTVPGIETVDGPAGLPDYLAYFAYQVENEADAKQIDKVSKAFTELLPNSGSWHTIKISLDTEGNQCMLQDKMHFQPNNAQCHIGLVWSGDSGREFWIVSHNPHGDGVRRTRRREVQEFDEDDQPQKMQQMSPDDW